ncbi:MAG: hypothetical protein IJ906_00505 [Oscillospiraceae bacterium]|nr:hypothetical protein [Oscillospiraceae bacterium]
MCMDFSSCRTKPVLCTGSGTVRGSMCNAMSMI